MRRITRRELVGAIAPALAAGGRRNQDSSAITGAYAGPR